MHITITDIVGESRIYLSYPIRDKEVTVVSVFSDNIQYEFTTLDCRSGGIKEYVNNSWNLHKARTD